MGANEDAPLTPIAALATIGPGDTTGTETLHRYVYQFKVAVQRWLGTLTSQVECHIVCEFVDDITLVTEDDLTFVQVKTRDRDSWTAAQIQKSKGGLDALIRSYNLAKAAGYRDRVRLELLLEGPPSSRSDTRRFFDNPPDATEQERERLRTLQLDVNDIDDFLGRLTITPQYYTRQTIDAAILRMLMTIIPGDTGTIESTYRTLLERAVAAHLGLAASADPESPLVLQAGLEFETASILGSHALSRTELLELLPPSPTLADEQRALLEAANAGPLSMSDLEFKLRVAGATDNTVDRAKARRAEASAELIRRVGLGPEADPAERSLKRRVLEYAEGVTADVVAAASTHSLRIRPANAIWGRLLQQTESLGVLDRDAVFGGDGSKVLGYLCHLSDQCLFGWREA